MSMALVHRTPIGVATDSRHRQHQFCYCFVAHRQRNVSHSSKVHRHANVDISHPKAVYLRIDEKCSRAESSVAYINLEESFSLKESQFQDAPPNIRFEIVLRALNETIQWLSERRRREFRLLLTFAHDTREIQIRIE